MNPNDPAFPFVEEDFYTGKKKNRLGIPIRLYIAAQIMAKMIPHEAPTKYSPEEMVKMISKTSLAFADALIAADNKETK